MVNDILEKEIEYINADVFDKSQDIYARAKHPNMPKFLQNSYLIKCKQLPTGTYNVPGKNIDLSFASLYQMFYCDQTDVDIRYYQEDVFTFILKKPLELGLIVGKCKNIENIVHKLREQALANAKMVDKSTLIQKDIKAHTDLGEDYNRESFYDAIVDDFNDSEELIVDESKPLSDPDVRYLRLMKLMQDKNELDNAQHELDERRKHLQTVENEIMKYQN